MVCSKHKDNNSSGRNNDNNDSTTTNNSVDGNDNIDSDNDYHRLR